MMNTSHCATRRLCLAIALACLVAGSSAAECADNKRTPANIPATGTIEGSVKFRGAIPKSPIADDAGMRRNLIEVDGESAGLRYVVAYLVADAAAVPPSNAPDNKVSSTKSFVDQRNHEFTPRVIAVRAGESVVFSNSDPANHNVRTATSERRNEFNVFTGIDGKYEHRFVVQRGYRPVQLGCDIHPWMQGWVYVFDHPHFAITDPNGTFRIESVPPGKYKLVLEQPDLRYKHERTIHITGDRAATVNIEVRPDDDGF